MKIQRKKEKIKKKNYIYDNYNDKDNNKNNKKQPDILDIEDYQKDENIIWR